MADYLSVTEWKTQLGKNKLLSGTGISEALRKVDTCRKGGTADAFKKAVKDLVDTTKKAQKKFLADKASKAYMDEIIKAATALGVTEVAARASEEMLAEQLETLSNLVKSAKNADALKELQQKVRAPAAAVAFVSKTKGSKGLLENISKDDWFNGINDSTFAAKKTELDKAVKKLQKLL